MHKFVVIIYRDYKKTIIAIFFLIELIVFLMRYHYYGVEFWSFIGALVFFIIFVDLVYNGSYLLIGRINSKSNIAEYYVRFVYILIIYFFSIYCIVV